MTPKAHNSDFVARVVAEFILWEHTPFHPYSAVPGVGVDCVHLAAQILAGAGVFPEGYTFPRYIVGGGHHSGSSTVETWLDSRPEFVRVPPEWNEETLLVGDVLCFRIGKVAHHVGVVIETTGPVRFGHVMIHGTVRTGQLDDPTYRARLLSVFRPIE